jgi:Uma2 family endonuclease
MPNLAYAEDRRFTYADYKAWELKPGERYELIYGEAYAMAAPNTWHQRILSRLTAKFFNFLEGKPCEVFPAPYDVRLFYAEDESDDTVVQPDLIVVCDRGQLGEEGCRGAPNLVVEILSPSNTAVEMERKLSLYWEAGVREYWVVDHKNKHIRMYVTEEGEYRMRTFALQDTLRSEAVPGLEIGLEALFAE